MREDVKWKPHPRCHRPHALWSAPDKDATEHEVTAFVAALVRLTKPLLVVETGTYEGHTTVAIAEALDENQDDGRVVSFEVDVDRALRVAEGLRDWARVTIVAAPITREHVPAPVDLAFLDSGMRSRDDDMRVVWPLLRPGGIVLVHDASPDRPPGLVRPPGPHAFLEVATPRGLNVFQKPHA